MKNKFIGLLVCAVLLSFYSGCSKETSSQIEIRLTDAGWDSIRFHNAVVSFIADKAFNLKTTVVSGSTPITHTAILNGDIDVNVETWTDNIRTYNDDIAAGKIIELGVNFDDNMQGFYVPRYVIEGDPKRGIAASAPELRTVKDLKKYKEVFKDDEIPSKGRIYGAIPGWDVDTIMYNKYLYYKLDEDFVYFRPGSDATLGASFSSAYEKGLPIVGYYWEPTWLTGKYDLVVLQDEPYTNLEDFKAGKTATPPVRVTVIAHPSLVAKAPEFTEFLKKYQTSSALTAEALAHIADTGADYDQAAVHFLQQHKEFVDQWLPAKEAALVHKVLKEEK